MSALLESVEPLLRREIGRFVDSCRHKKDVDRLSEMRFTTEMMELAERTGLPGDDKKRLTCDLYQSLAVDDNNGYSADFKIGEAIELVMDISNQKYGIKVKSKSCFSFFAPCCSSVTVGVKGKAVSVDVQAPQAQGST